MFDPNTISGLTRYYNGAALTGTEGAPVDPFPDSSITGDDAVASGTPLLRLALRNGLNAIEFDSTASFSLTEATDSNQTWFAVIRVDPAAGNTRMFTSDGTTNSFCSWANTLTGEGQFSMVIPGQRDYHGFPTDDWIVLIWKQNGDVTNSLRRNKTLMAHNGGSLGVGHQLKFATIGGQGGYCFHGHVGAMGYYDRTLSDLEEETLVNGLIANWKLNTLVFIAGNSLSTNYAVTTPQIWHQVVKASLGGYLTTVNKAAAGQTTQQLTAGAFAESFGWQVDAARPKCVIVVWEGVNDIIVNSLDGAEAADNLIALSTSYMGLGAEVWVFTVLPRDDAPFNLIQVDCNTALRDPALIGVAFHRIVDVAAHPSLSTWSGTFFSDATHLNAAGQAVVGGMVTPLLAESTASDSVLGINGINGSAMLGMV